MYEGDLVADASVKDHLLKDLPRVSVTSETSLPMLLIDTASCGLHEQRVEETKEGLKCKLANICFSLMFSIHIYLFSFIHLVPSWIEGSKANDGEVEIVFKHVLALLKAGLKGSKQTKTNKIT